MKVSGFPHERTLALQGLAALILFSSGALDGFTAAGAPPERPAGAGGEVLATHNTLRSKHCVPALKWSSQLAAGAQAWAASCTFAHSVGAWKGANSYGENLAWGTNLSGAQAVNMWYNEIRFYNFSAPVWNKNVAHFTQVIWRGSTQLGCGSARCKGRVYWVCRYSPPGNWNAAAPGVLSRNVPRKCR